MICAVAVKPEPRAPSFVKPFNDVTVVTGEPLALQAQIIGFPVPEIKWLKDGIPLRPSEAVNFIMQPDGIIGIKYVVEYHVKFQTLRKILLYFPALML